MKRVNRITAFFAALCLLFASIIPIGAFADETADADVIFSLSADKTEGLQVGDEINVTVTPEKVNLTDGICAYAMKINFDSSVLSFTGTVTNSHAQIQVSANESGEGKVNLVAVDNSYFGLSLFDGDAVTTLTFEVIGGKNQTEITLTELNATRADNLESASCALKSNLTLFGREIIPSEESFSVNVSANKTEKIHVGDEISVTVTPDDITAENGLSAYSISEITFDSNVLTLHNSSVTVAKDGYNAAVNELSNGKISLTVSKNAPSNEGIKSGEAAVTIKFNVIAYAPKTEIVVTGTVMGTENGTENNIDGIAAGRLNLYGESVVSPPQEYDNTFVLTLSLNEVDHVHIGQTVAVYLSPTEIKSPYGICSYDAKAIAFDNSVLKFTENVENTNRFMQTMAYEKEPGIISLMATDNSPSGLSIKDGDGIAILYFEVIAEAESTEIEIIGEVSGTEANASLDGISGNAGEKLVIIGGLGREFTDSVHNPTCTEDGYTEYTCNGCDFSYTEEGESKTGHDYEADIHSPTCVDDGYTVYTCTACDDNYTEQGEEKTGHNYEADIYSPTCTEDGYTVYTCTACDDSYTEQGEEKTGHDFSELIDFSEPTGEAEGHNTYKCVNCDETYTETLPKLFKRGDVNGDGNINSTDFIQVRRHFLKLYVIPEEYLDLADVNGDGKINSTDFMQIRRHFLKLYVIE